VSNPEQPHTLPPVEHRILRLDEVQAKTGFKRAHLYTLMHKGEFPRTVRLGTRAVGWNCCRSGGRNWRLTDDHRLRTGAWPCALAQSD